MNGYGFCVSLLVWGSAIGIAQEEPRREGAQANREGLEEARPTQKMDDLDMRELEFQIQQREQSLPMLWSTIFSMESQAGDEEIEKEIARLKARTEQVKDEIRELRVIRERSAPQPASPAEARERAAEHLRQAEELLSEAGDTTAEGMVRMARTRLSSDRAAPSRGFERFGERSESESFRAPPSVRVPEELMERIRAASPERLERRLDEQGEVIRRLQEQVEQLRKIDGLQQAQDEILDETEERDE